MMYVYVPKVSVAHHGSGGWSVWKDVVKYRVVKNGTRYFTVNPWPENYGNMGNVQIEISRCYTDLEQAKRQADVDANNFIEMMTQLIEKLKLPANVVDNLSGVLPSG